MPDFPHNASDATSPSAFEMEPVVLVDCLFQVSHDIRSLPPFHGARWNAWIRFGCERAHVRAEDLVRAIFPFRSGQEHLKKGEILALRLAIDAAGLDLLPRLVVGMRNTGAEGKFCPQNLEFVCLVDPIRRKPLADGAPVEKVLSVVRRDDFATEIALCQKCTRLRLDFLSPLRLTLPAGQKNVHMSARERLCDAEWFASFQDALGHLLGKVRFLPSQAPASGAHIVESSLRWQEVRYNAERCVAVGGILGTLRIEGELDEDSAARLVLGQYFGAGKSGRFGLGFWRIRELEAVRTLALPDVQNEFFMFS